jgi:hypothetical protein
MNDAITIRPRSVRQVSIDSGQPYASFRAAYETAVPVFDRLEAAGVVRSGAGWSGITALSDATAGSSLVISSPSIPAPETEHGTWQISSDLPADLMAVFGQSVLDDVGTGAGKTLAGLLTHLGLSVPAELHAAASNRELCTTP